jgi:hypothetical protein
VSNVAESDAGPVPSNAR